MFTRRNPGLYKIDYKVGRWVEYNEDGSIRLEEMFDKEQKEERDKGMKKETEFWSQEGLLPKINYINLDSPSAMLIYLG